MNRRIDIAAAGCIALLLPAVSSLAQPCVMFADVVLHSSKGFDDPTCIASGDINNDGIVDLVIATRLTYGTLVVQYGKDGGEYSDPIVMNAGGNDGYTNWCTLLDFDLDGNLDLFLARRSGPCQLLQGDGAGNFTLTDEAANFEFATCAIAADFDGDGRDDILLSGTDGARVIFIDQNGQMASEPDLVSGQAIYPFVADLDADGDFDILIPAGSAKKVCLFENISGGSFASRIAISTGTTTPTSILAADFDMDNDLDLAVAIIDGSINVYENDGNGGFDDAIIFDIPQAEQDPWHLSTSDFNNDDLPDLVFTGGVTNRVGILTNRSVAGDIVFSVAQLNQCPGLPNMALLIDSDTDDDVDIIVPTVNGGDSSIAYIENLTSGTACYADVSGDGTIDLNDVVEVFVEWGKTKSHADLNKDSVVNGIDLTIVLNNWGEL